MSTTPYIIKQIQLDSLPSESLVPITAGLRYYLQYWWKDIALGHLFIEQDNPMDATTMRKRVWDAISPAISFYQHQSLVYKSADASALFLQDKRREFYVFMDTLFANFTDLVLPHQTEISVIICTRNRPADLERCLVSLQAQACAPNEIIVVDNAPTDDSTLRVVQRFRKVIYHKEPRGGLSIARNTGLRMASSPLIAFTDDDVALHPLWLYHVQESFATPQVGAMTGLVLPSSLATQSQQLFEKQWSFNGGYRDKLFDSTFFSQQMATGPRVWDIGAGANMAFRRSAIEAAGYFDERLGAGASGCSEDSEMWYRILAKGMTIHYNPRAAVFHEHRKEMAALHKQLYSYMKGHAAAALLQQDQIPEAGYRRYLFKMCVKGYLPQLTKRFFQPFERKLLLIQLHGIITGILFYLRHRNKPAQENAWPHRQRDRQPVS